jgi:hypothetical protein
MCGAGCGGEGGFVFSLAGVGFAEPGHAGEGGHAGLQGNRKKVSLKAYLWLYVKEVISVGKADCD